MLTRKSIIDYFVDADIADKQVEQLKTSTGFLVSCLINGWKEFQQMTEVALIKLIDLEKPSGRNNSSGMVLSVSFTTGQVMSALCIFPLGLDSQPAVWACLEKADENTKKVMLASLNKQFNSQAEFYRLFVKESSIPDFPLPNVYYVQKADDGYNGPPMIILQNLKMADCGHGADGEQEQNCGLKEFTQPQLEDIAKKLANFHKHLLCLEDDEWKSSFGACPLLEHATLVKHMHSLPNNMVGELNELAKKFRQLMSSDQFKQELETVKQGMPQVLQHGGLSSATVLFSESNPSVVDVFIDWRAVSLGNVAFDLELAVSCSECSVNKEDCNSKVMQLYYDTLRRLMEEEGRELVFTPKQLKKAFQICKLISTLQMLLLAGVLAGEACEKKSKKFMERAQSAVIDAIKILEELSVN